MTDKSGYQPGEPIWIDLSTPSVDASVAFYAELFGWTAEPGDPQFGGYGTLRKDGKSIAGIMPLMSPEQPPVWTSYFASADADATTALVTANGGAVYAPPMDVGDLGRMAVFADPGGAAFGIWQAGVHTGAEVVDEEGTFAWTELSSRNLAGMLPFYDAVFGWSAKQTPDYTEFQLGGTSVAGAMDTPDTVPAEVPSSWMPYFLASDPGAQAERAASLGGTVLVPATEMAELTFAIVADPHGSTFGLLTLKT